MDWDADVSSFQYSSCIQTVLVILILLCMIGSMVSGIIISRYIFRAFNIHFGTAFAKSIHMLCAYWGFVFMSIHLGFHWNTIIAMARKAFSKQNGKIVKGRRVVLRTIARLVAIYGIIAFVKRDILNYMTLKNHFAFFDLSEPVIFFLLDYLAIMGLFVLIGYYLNKGLIEINNH